MKKSFKKVLASALVVSMLLAMSAMTVMANPSGEVNGSPEAPAKPPTSTGSNENPVKPPSMGGVTEGTYVVNGVTKRVSIAEVNAEVQTAINSEDKLIALLGNKYIRGTTLQILGSVDASVEAGTPMPVRLTFNVAGVKKGDVIKILHQKADKSWEVLDTTTGDGTVSAVFTSLSPVVFVKEITTDGTGTGPVKSPTTGRL